MGFEAEINIVAKAKVKVDKFSTASRGAKVGKSSTASRNANNNIKGLDINNLTASLIILTDLIFIEAVKTVTKVIKILLNRKIIVIAIRFLYYFINF